jgi:hypothetical protein
MRRFVTLVVLFLFSIPFGVSISGCSKQAAPVFCNGGDSGLTTGQVTTITLTPIVYGVSLNYAEIGQLNSPSATDCKGSNASAQAYTYGTTDMTIADVQPNSGRLCGGTWNRNSGGGIPDYTVCIPTNKTGTAYISASAAGVTSNPIPVFVHPVVTSIVLGADSSSVLTAAITGYSITANIPTFNAANSYTLGEVVSLYGFPTSSNFFNTPAITNATIVPYTAGISGYSIAANTPTFFTPLNSFAAGQVVTLANFPNSTFFNGITTAVVQAAGLSATQFTASIPGFTHANVSQTSEIGTASGGLSSTQFTLSIPVIPSRTIPTTTTSVDTGFAGAPDCPTNPTTSCCPLATVGSATAPPYQATSCVSQGTTWQLGARIYAGPTTVPTNNISCQAGHLQFSASQSASSPVVSIDPNGVATANQPGSVLISANIADAASSAGFFSTCPPASITLTPSGTTSNPVVVDQNNTQPLLVTALDTNGTPLTGLSLTYVSTTPTTIPAGAGSVVPSLAGAASNSVNILAPGTNSTVLYMASSQSQYIESRDFTQNALSAPLRLPYIPNSMVISTDGSTIYLGSSTALMVLSAVNTLSVSRTDITSPGTVLAISPDGTQIVLSDPVKQITTIETSSGGVVSTYGGVGTRAQYTPDSQTLYIAAGNQLLVYSSYTGWTNITPATPVSPLVAPVTDVAVTVPGVGAYFAGTTTTARSYCPITTATSSPTIETNVFYPQADSSAAITDRIAATNDGLHILGATVTQTPTLNDLRVEIPSGNPNGPSVSVTCPLAGTLTFSNTVSPIALPITATAITGVTPASDSSVAFVTYLGTGGVLPAYKPSTQKVQPVTLLPVTGSPAPVAPISGVISADNQTFFTGTSGDNLVHLLTPLTPGVTTGPWQDNPSSALAPKLTTPTGTAVSVDLMVQKPRKAT